VRTCQFQSHHGKPEKETPPEDEQAQAPEALEIESPQEAHVAEIAALAWRVMGPIAPAACTFAAGFYLRGRRLHGKWSRLGLNFKCARNRRAICWQKPAAL
jgi:hypothetical protein